MVSVQVRGLVRGVVVETALAGFMRCGNWESLRGGRIALVILVFERLVLFVL